MKFKKALSIPLILSAISLSGCSNEETPVNDFYSVYLSAEQKYGVDWYVLSAIHEVESKSSDTISKKSDYLGPLNFKPATWVGWKNNIGHGQVSKDLDITNLDVISEGNGYGIDGDGDGIADPIDVEDSIYTLANFLSKNGYSESPQKAILQFNHEDKYTTEVLALSETIKDSDK
jgi:hypothetical protein